MAFHIMMPSAMEAPGPSKPRHAMRLLGDRLNATIHQPTSDHKRENIIRERLLPTSQIWALARQVKALSSPHDTLFCPSEAGGLHVAALYSGEPVRPKIAVFVHNVDRPRARAAMRLWNMRLTVDLWLACSEYQVEFLERYLRLPRSSVIHICDHTDNEFFTPGPASANKQRPLIVSVGLEQRDYHTLALATSDMNVDVRISGFSNDANSTKKGIPDPLPSNMTMKFYEWPELVQLYRDADVVVVSCFPNKYAAGVQSLMEGAACDRPIIVTQTEGLKYYIDSSMTAIPPGDALAMRSAIMQLLNRSESNSLPAKRFEMNRYVSEMEDQLRRLSSNVS